VKRLSILLYALVFLHVSCRRASPSAAAHTLSDSVARTKDTFTQQAAEDSLQNLFLQDKCFFATIISLDDNDSKAFVFTDTAYFGKDLLTNADRFDYYRKARALLPKEKLHAHQLAWQIKELREAQRGNGGYGTLVTWTTLTDTAEGLYEISVKTNNADHLSTFSEIPSLRIWSHTGRIEVETIDDGYMPLKQWRKRKKTGDY